MSLKYQTRRLDDSYLGEPSLPKCCFYYNDEYFTKVYELPEGGPELDAFVADLFNGGPELCSPGVYASPQLIPTIIQAFKARSARIDFRPLRLASAVWTDAAERSVRPCPYCVAVLKQSNAIIKVPHVTDRYHVQNAHTDQQMTIEFSYRCRPYDEPEHLQFNDELPLVSNSPYWA
ncbi:hypothetical protein AAVH_09676 [Aphelenchoides avenae]|nr:hypothetical protein AAVH_09676 [Aphelenchus avenae]